MLWHLLNLRLSFSGALKKRFSKEMFSKYHELIWNELGSELKTSSKLQDVAQFQIL